MDTIGWQIGEFLSGFSAFIIAIYVSKLLNSANDILKNFNRTMTYNERYINEIIQNISSISKQTEELIETINNISGIMKIFSFYKRKRK